MWVSERHGLGFTLSEQAPPLDPSKAASLEHARNVFFPDDGVHALSGLPVRRPLRTRSPDKRSATGG